MYLFLDTNTLLHFKRPDQVDWAAICSSDSVTLVITPVVIRELEKQKVQNPVRKLKNRAQTILSWLATFIEEPNPVTIRDNVFVHFIRTSPLIDFAANRLSRDIFDDELIGSALEFRNDTAHSVKIVTADLGLRLKLPEHHLDCISPPQAAQLPEEPDETERELAEVRRELDRYQGRRPKLALLFTDGTNFAELLLKRGESARNVRRYPVVGGFLPGDPPQAEYARYHRELAAWRSFVELLCPCRLQLTNSGTFEATDIEITFSLPEFLTAIRSDDAPDEPQPPRSIFEPYHGFGNITAVPHLGARPATRPYVSDSGALSFRIPSLVHHRTLELDEFYFKFARPDVIQNFAAEYTITCRESFDPIKATLNIRAL